MSKSYYGVAKGRNPGVYDNWSDCQAQVNRYSGNDYRKFESPDTAWNYVDQRSAPTSAGKNFVQDSGSSQALVPKGNNQVALGGNSGETRSYQRTDYTEGRNGIIMRDRSYTSGRQGNGHFVERRTRTYWESN